MQEDERTDDREPDYRMSLAGERTYLAYLRTGLALIAAGVAVAGALPNAGAETLRRLLGLVLVGAGGAVFVVARRRWLAIDDAMRRGASLRPSRSAQALGLALVVIAIAAAVVVVLI